MFATLETSFAEYDNNVANSEAKIIRARIGYRQGDYVAARRFARQAFDLIKDETLPSYMLEVETLKIDLALASSDKLSTNSCDKFEQVIGVLEHQESVLRARGRLVHCRARSGGVGRNSASSQLKEIVNQARNLGLFEPMLDAQIQQATLLRHLGRDREARAARQSALKLAATNGWDISWVKE